MDIEDIMGIAQDPFNTQPIMGSVTDNDGITHTTWCGLGPGASPLAALWWPLDTCVVSVLLVGGCVALVVDRGSRSCGC